MRYIDITLNGITETLKASDLRFKTQIEDTINIRSRNKNLIGMNNLSQALDYLDDLSVSSVGGGDSIELDQTILSINSRIKSYESGPQFIHEFKHDMNTEYLKYDIWVYDNGWVNNIVPIRIIDQDTVEVQLTRELSCRIILTNINDITKTYNI